MGVFQYALCVKRIGLSFLSVEIFCRLFTNRILSLAHTHTHLHCDIKNFYSLVTQKKIKEN